MELLPFAILSALLTHTSAHCGSSICPPGGPYCITDNRVFLQYEKERVCTAYYLVEPGSKRAALVVYDNSCTVLGYKTVVRIGKKVRVKSRLPFVPVVEVRSCKDDRVAVWYNGTEFVGDRDGYRLHCYDIADNGSRVCEMMFTCSEPR